MVQPRRGPGSRSSGFRDGSIAKWWRQRVGVSHRVRFGLGSWGSVSDNATKSGSRQVDFIKSSRPKTFVLDLWGEQTLCAGDTRLSRHRIPRSTEILGCLAPGNATSPENPPQVHFTT